jgi:hypothetical protein
MDWKCYFPANSPIFNLSFECLDLGEDLVINWLLDMDEVRKSNYSATMSLTPHHGGPGIKQGI